MFCWITNKSDLFRYRIDKNQSFQINKLFKELRSEGLLN